MNETAGVTRANALLQAAFPWRATVDNPGKWTFLSLSYEAEEADEHEALLRFDRDEYSNTIVRASWEQLEAARTSGAIEADGRIVRQPEIADLRHLEDPLASMIGAQSSSDDPWRARMRLHQSWWRAFRLRVPPGYGPNKGSTVLRGNMLDTAAADAGLNFLGADAFQAYTDRHASGAHGVDPWRTPRNLLASQPMAFNLFGHLSRNLDLATAVLAELLGPDEVAEVTGIEIERLSNALGDHTAFDAFATYTRPDGDPACLTIETKLTEPFSQQSYDWTKYTAHAAYSREIWATDNPAEIGNPRWSQLFRNHLLAVAESAAHPQLGAPTVLVVHHPEDPHCDQNVLGYRQLLADRSAVQAVDLGRIAAALRSVVDTDSDRQWLTDLEDRYLNLELSAPLADLLARQP
jgi:hypothetical protein